MLQRPILEAVGISKSFPGVQALAKVDLKLAAGEVHALVGANGAGKSTLVKILAGALRADSGTVYLDGMPVVVASPREAFRRGIALIHQEPNVVPQLNVLQNIFLGREKLRKGLPGRLDVAAMEHEARGVLSQLGAALELNAVVGELGIAQKQIVEIARALVAKGRVLIFDEPTAALTPGEVRRLFELIAQLKKRGVGIVYISHRLPEIFQIADRVTVLRDGRVVACRPVAEVTPTELVAWMAGRPSARGLAAASPSRGRAESPEILRLEDCGRAGRLESVSLTVKRGEVVGLTGLLGSGRTEVALGLMGLLPFDRGRVWFDGRPVTIPSPRKAKSLGIALLPEDRRAEGLCAPLALRENVAHAALTRLFPWFWVSLARERELARGYMARLGIVAPHPDVAVQTLSGGNQQKVVLAKWLSTRARLFVFDEPTRGIDVSAKGEMHRLIRQLADEGAGVIVISSELPEIAALCDRTYVMREGSVVAELGPGPSEEEILLHATGAAA